MSSIGMMNGLSVTRSGIGMWLSTASIRSSTVFSHCGSPFSAPSALTRTQVLAGAVAVDVAGLQTVVAVQHGPAVHVFVAERRRHVGVPTVDRKLRCGVAAARNRDVFLD